MRRAYSLTREHKLTIPHTGWDGFGFVAHLHLCAAIPNSPYVEVLHEPNGQTVEAMVDRIVHLGFEVRVELLLESGERIWAQVTRDEAEQLDLEKGQVVFVRPSRTQVFRSAAP